MRVLRALSVSVAMLALAAPAGAQAPRAVTPADITYAGAIRVPAIAALNYAYGALTIRRQPDGTKTLLLSGTPGTAQSLVEIALPAPAAGDPLQAPRAALVRDWTSSAWCGLRTGVSGTGPLETESLYFDAATQRLWFTFSNYYDTTGGNSAVLAAVTLNADGTATAGGGPWLTDQNQHRVRSYCVRIPDWFVGQYTSGATLAFGGGLLPGNGGASWGPCLYAIAPAATAGLAPGSTLGTQALLGYTMTARLSRPGDYGWPTNIVPSAGYKDGPGGTINPNPDGTGGVWTPSDWCYAAAWIDTPTVSGPVFVGREATGAVWYGEGTIELSDGTTITSLNNPNKGEQCEGARPVMYLYDPADVALVAQGIAQPSDLAPSARIDPRTIAPQLVLDKRCLFKGACWDPDTSTLYVSAWNAENPGGSKRYPIVYAFRVGS